MSSKLNNIVRKKIKVVNPRYAGAKPEDVARALLRPVSGAALTRSSLAVASRSRRKAIRGGKVAEQEPTTGKGSRNKRHLVSGV